MLERAELEKATGDVAQYAFGCGCGNLLVAFDNVYEQVLVSFNEYMASK